MFGHHIDLSQSDIVQSINDSIHIDSTERETGRLDAHADAADSRIGSSETPRQRDSRQGDSAEVSSRIRDKSIAPSP
jgi:hypothetical protein